MLFRFFYLPSLIRFYISSPIINILALCIYLYITGLTLLFLIDYEFEDVKEAFHRPFATIYYLYIYFSWWWENKAILPLKYFIKLFIALLGPFLCIRFFNNFFSNWFIVFKNKFIKCFKKAFNKLSFFKRKK